MLSVLVCLVLPISEMAGTEELDWAELGLSLSSSLCSGLSVSDNYDLLYLSIQLYIEQELENLNKVSEVF